MSPPFPEAVPGLAALAAPADRHGRLAPAPDLLEAIARAAAEAWPRSGTGPPRAGRIANPWRFSGRWWAAPLLLRRERP